MGKTENYTIVRTKPPLQFTIYNANYDVVYVNPLAKDFVKHSGSIRYLYSGQEDVKFNSISLIRLQFEADAFDFLSRPFFLLDKKINISSYFSVNQFQSTIVDIPIGVDLEDLNIRVPLKFMEHCTVALYDGLSSNKIHEQGAYVVVENNSLESVKVNLIELFKGVNSNEKIKITNNDFNENRTNYQLMRIWTKNSNQFEMPILNKCKNNYNVIEPIANLSILQYQSGIIDIYETFDLKETEDIETTIMGNTKVMYHLV